MTSFKSGCYINYAVSCFLLAVFSSVSAQEGVMITTFIPVQGKTQEFVTVEVIRRNEDNQYRAVVKAVLSGGWRQEEKGDYYQIPGKCTVAVFNSQYVVDCWLLHSKGRDILREKAQTCEQVVAIVKTFSRLRSLRQPPRGVGVAV